MWSNKMFSNHLLLLTPKHPKIRHQPGVNVAIMYFNVYNKLKFCSDTFCKNYIVKIKINQRQHKKKKKRIIGFGSQGAPESLARKEARRKEREKKRRRRVPKNRSKNAQTETETNLTGTGTRLCLMPPAQSASCQCSIWAAGAYGSVRSLRST